jgi:hypothetical protein
LKIQGSRRQAHSHESPGRLVFPFIENIVKKETARLCFLRFIYYSKVVQSQSNPPNDSLSILTNRFCPFSSSLIQLTTLCLCHRHQGKFGVLKHQYLSLPLHSRFNEYSLPIAGRHVDVYSFLRIT